MTQTETTQQRGKPGWRDRLNFNIVAAMSFILFAIFFLVIIPDQIEKPLVILGQTQNGLTPTLFPRVAAVLLLLISLWYLIIAFGLKETNLIREINLSGLRNSVVTIVVLLTYALSMESLGFVISTTLVVALLTHFYGNRNLLITLLSSILLPVGIYNLFTKILLVSLPENPFFETGFF